MTRVAFLGTAASALVLMAACGRGARVPQVPVTEAASAPASQEDGFSDEPEREGGDEPVAEEVSSEWMVSDGLLGWRRGNELHLLDADSLDVVATITSPDGTAPDWIEVAPDGTRFLMVSEGRRLSLWTSSGALIAAGREKLDEEEGRGSILP